MKDFAAIDFETANNQRSSICSVGVVIVRNGEIVDSVYSLIQPEPNYYNYLVHASPWTHTRKYGRNASFSRSIETD